MTFWLIMVPALVAGHPGATRAHWHRTHAACLADERAFHLPPGSCLKTQGAELPPPGIDLDSDGALSLSPEGK